ncbi:hypothetical protein BDU57DRAFT_511039 [Ampelomyces quisqualis]|uniref:Uncharacterized protein n=1 Tax=Ampelomyces quisqualis TaxID=50730 RepID=A0A6A5R1M3_AMPQU|nr:hypothetical protein BDU57DRAFT_511039 [Ampelomyces quisqualis]
MCKTATCRPSSLLRQAASHAFHIGHHSTFVPVSNSGTGSIDIPVNVSVTSRAMLLGRADNIEPPWSSEHPWGLP